jgi:predicted PhzF superfamily epimerase YddE/YHI9
VIDARSTSMGGDDRFILVLRDVRVAARVRLRPVAPMSGMLLDPVTGQTVGVLHHTAADGEFWDIEPGRESEMLLLALRADGAAAPAPQ